MITHVDSLGLNFVCAEEGCVLYPYDDHDDARLTYHTGYGYLRADGRAPIGYATIGIGHLIRNGEVFGDITKDRALAIFDEDSSNTEAEVVRWIQTDNQNHFNCFFDFAINCGAGKLHNNQLPLFNGSLADAYMHGNFDMCRKIMAQFVHSKGAVDERLKGRRAREWALFNRPVVDQFNVEEVLAEVSVAADKIIADELAEDFKNRHSSDDDERVS